MAEQTLEEVFGAYRDAVAELRRSLDNQTADKLRLRVTDAEVELAEAMFRDAEDALFEFNGILR